MITETRLQELIDQKATIYEVKHNKVKSIELKWKVEIGYKSQYIVVYPSTKFLIRCYCNRLFETQEEAEWHNEFGNITRTETLELPTWEEFHGKTYYNKHYGIIFQGKASGCTYQMQEELTPENIIIYDADCQDIVFSKPPTKENYTLACRKCKELFLGENDEKV